MLHALHRGHFQPKQQIAGARGGAERRRPLLLVTFGHAEDQLIAAKLIDTFQHLIELGCHIDFRRCLRWVDPDRRESPFATFWRNEGNRPGADLDLAVLGKLRTNQVGGEDFSIVRHRQDVPLSR